MTDYFWVLKRCILLTLTFSNLPFFATRRRCWGKCESIYIDNCTRRVRSLKTDTLVLHVRSKYRMNGTVAPICSCSCLLGNRDPATLWNVGNYLPTNKLAHPKIILLTPWCRVLPEKLTGLQLVKKFPAFHGTRRFITALTSVRHLSQSWASPIQSIYSHPTSWRSILMLSTHLRLGLPSGLFPSGFPTKTLYTPSPHPYAPHAQPISFFSILLPARYWVRSTDQRNIKNINLYSEKSQFLLNVAMNEHERHWDCQLSNLREIFVGIFVIESATIKKRNSTFC